MLYGMGTVPVLGIGRDEMTDRHCGNEKAAIHVKVTRKDTIKHIRRKDEKHIGNR